MIKSLQRYNKNLTLPKFTRNFAYAAFSFIIRVIYQLTKENETKRTKTPLLLFIVRAFFILSQV